MATNTQMKPSGHVMVYDNWDDPDIFKTVGRRAFYQIGHGRKVQAYGRWWWIKNDDGTWVLDFETDRPGTEENPSKRMPKGWIPASAVKIERRNGAVEVKIRR